MYNYTKVLNSLSNSKSLSYVYTLIPLISSYYIFSIIIVISSRESSWYIDEIPRIYPLSLWVLASYWSIYLSVSRTIIRVVEVDCFKPELIIKSCFINKSDRLRTGGTEEEGSSKADRSRRVLDSVIRDTPLNTPYGLCNIRLA